MITNPEYVLTFKKALQGLVNEIGINLKIIPQANPTGGIAEALLLGLEEDIDTSEDDLTKYKLPENFSIFDYNEVLWKQNN